MKILTYVFLCLLLGQIVTAPINVHADAKDVSDNVSMLYDDTQNMSIVFAHEKLVDGNTGLGAAYGYTGHVLHGNPKTVSLSLFGYHDTAQWQNIDTLTVAYDGKLYAHHAIHSLHGEDRDKSEDLVNSVYYETTILEMPFDTAKQIFSSKSVAITSAPAGITLTLTPLQMDRCRELLASIPTVAAIQPPDPKEYAPSVNGLPVTRNISETEGDATLATTPEMITPRFGLQCLAFVTVSGRQIHQPTEALLISELADAPVLETEKKITLNYGDTHLTLTSNVGRTSEATAGVKMSVRTYPITYSRFLVISKARNLSFTVGNLTVPIPPQKMVGIQELARRIH